MFVLTTPDGDHFINHEVEFKVVSELNPSISIFKVGDIVTVNNDGFYYKRLMVDGKVFQSSMYPWWSKGIRGFGVGLKELSKVTLAVTDFL